MAKTGRNALCPCGSGKKYKKCCLKKDEEQRAELRMRLNKNQETEKTVNSEENIRNPSVVQDQNESEDMDEVFNDEYYEDRLDRDFDDDDFEWDLEDNDRLPVEKNTYRLNLPEISEEESALIDVWYEKFKEMDDPDEIKNHLDAFISEYPHLVDHLELHEEVLFEINFGLFRQNRHAEVVTLLEQIRQQYPLTYEQNHGYYDLNLVAYKIATNKKDHIPPLLNYFKANPDKDPDNLFPLIDLLKLSNCREILQDFIPDIYMRVRNSSNIMDGDTIMDTVVALCLAPFVKPDYTRQDMEILSEKLTNLYDGMHTDRCSPESLHKMFDQIFAKVTGWKISDCSTKKKKLDRYADIVLNFQGYLHSCRGMDWTTAVYYGNRVFKYLYENIPPKKQSGNPFIFSKDLIELTAVRLSRGLLGVNSIGFFGMLNAIFFFADYLYETQSISHQYHTDICKWCRELFEMAYPIQCKEDFEAIVFKRFPLEF